jgi:periplasmic protein TonB
MKYFFSLFLICLLTNARSQDKNQFFALDAKGNQTVLDSSKYMLWIHQKDDNDWQWDYYHTWGPLVKSQTFADHDGKILNGRSCFYNVSGNLDSVGIFDHGKRNGTFFKYRSITQDSFVVAMQYDYIQDSLVKRVNFLADSETNKKTDTSGIESEYPGGITQWYDYLVRHLVYPARAYEKEAQGQVRIFFMVDTAGNVNDPFIYRSVEYSLDQESVKLIQKSGKWTPATKNGTFVNSYKSQPINFKLVIQ